MDLPRKWPGRVRVRQALTLMRLSAKWYTRIEEYASASKPFQKRRYWWFREEFYYHIYGIHPDHPDTRRIGR